MSRQRVNRQPQGLQEILAQDLTGVDRRQFGSLALHLNILLVVVGEFNFVSITAIPAKADSILVIHANTVLPGSVPLEGFEPIAWWNSQVVERRRPMQQTQTLPVSLLSLQAAYRIWSLVQLALLVGAVMVAIRAAPGRRTLPPLTLVAVGLGALACLGTLARSEE